LILLDINLPDIDGYEVARRLRSSGDNKLIYTPIIAITANALKGDAEKALAAGCDVYMSKPINIRELWARVEAFLPVNND
jgi:CheY-like chemotaxis protein